MMRKIFKNKKVLFIFLFIIIIFFLFRIPNLTLQPVFADEAIYIRWAQIMKSEPTLRFISLQDGKTPLFMWLMIPALKIFDSNLVGVNDPLFAGRFLSIVSGFFTMIAVFLIGWRFYYLKIGLWGAFLVSIIPFLVFFDRLALVDSMLATFSTWSLLIALYLVKFPRLDLAMILGYFLGASVLTKTSGLFNFLSLPISILSFEFNKEKRANLIKLLSFWLVSGLIGLALYNILRLGDGFINLSSRNSDYIRSPLGLLKTPLDPLIPHLRDLFGFLSSYLTFPVLLLSILGIIVSFYKKNRVSLAIFFWAFTPIIIQLFLLQTFTARYIIFSIPALLILTSLGIDFLLENLRFAKNIALVLVMILLLPFILYFNLTLLYDPKLTPLHKNERKGYLEDWTAGYGFKEIANFLIEKSKREGLVVVGTEGFFGTLPEGLLIYLEKYNHSVLENKRVVVNGSRATVSDELRKTSLEHPTYFVANKSRFSQPLANMTLIKEYPKAKGFLIPQDSILFYQVFPN